SAPAQRPGRRSGPRRREARPAGPGKTGAGLGRHRGVDGVLRHGLRQPPLRPRGGLPGLFITIARDSRNGPQSRAVFHSGDIAVNIRFSSAALAAALALVLPLHAHAQVKVGVVVSATGPTALVGIPQQNTVPLLPPRAGGRSIEYITLDDASDPTQTVTAFKKLISETHVD